MLPSCIILNPSHLTSPHLTSSHLTSPHLTSPHLISSKSFSFLFALSLSTITNVTPPLFLLHHLLYECNRHCIYRTDALTKAEERERGFGQCAICMSDNVHTGKETIPHSAARVDFGSPKSSRQSGGDCIEFSIIRIIHRHTAGFCPSYERIFSELFQYHLIFFDSILFLKINWRYSSEQKASI